MILGSRYRLLCKRPSVISLWSAAILSRLSFDSRISFSFNVPMNKPELDRGAVQEVDLRRARDHLDWSQAGCQTAAA